MKTKTHKRSKKNKIIKNIKNKKGGNETSLTLFDKLDNKQIILDKLESISSKTFSNDSTLVNLRNTYSSIQNVKDHLYDFIFDLTTKQLIKIWDHSIGQPLTITAGLPGIHIYATLEPNGKLVKKIIGTFVRK